MKWFILSIRNERKLKKKLQINIKGKEEENKIKKTLGFEFNRKVCGVAREKKITLLYVIVVQNSYVT